MPDTRLRDTVLMEQNEDGGYTVTVPSLPGCISEGAIREEALAATIISTMHTVT